MTFEANTESINGVSIFVTRDLVISAGNQGNYNRKVLVCTVPLTITLAPGIMSSLKLEIRPPETGTVILQAASTVTLNARAGGAASVAGVSTFMEVSYTSSNRFTSSVSGAGAGPINITGRPVVGSSISAVIGAGYTNTGGNWTRDGVNISGATALDYTVALADVGTVITYKSSNINFLPPGLIGLAAPAIAASPVITTVSQLNQSALGVPVTWTPGASNGNITYLLKNAAGAGLATVSGTYIPLVNGETLTLVMTATTGAGQVNAISNTVIVGASAVSPTVTVQPVLTAQRAGSPVSWTAGAADGAVSTTQVLRKNGADVLSAASGLYLNTAGADKLDLVTTYTGADGGVAVVTKSVTLPAADNRIMYVASTNNPYPREFTVGTRGRAQAGRWPLTITGGPKALRASFSNARIRYDGALEEINPASFNVVSMALERASNNTVVPWPFLDGSRSQTIQPGAIDFHTADIPASAFGLTTFPDDEIFYLKIITHAPTATDGLPGGRFGYERDPLTNASTTRVNGYNPDTVTVSSTDTAGAFTASAGFPSWGGDGSPAARGLCPVILGIYDSAAVRAICMTGDSISEGGADRVPFPRIAAQTAKVGMLQFTVSTAASNCLTSATPYHRAYYRYTRVLLDEFGTNLRSDTASVLAAWAAWKAATGRDAVYRTRLTPRSSAVSRQVTAATVSGGVISVTMESAADIAPVGATVSISGIVPSTYNGSVVILSVSGKTITYNPVGTAPTDPATSVTAGKYNDLYATEGNQLAQLYTNDIETFNQFLVDQKTAGTIKDILPLNGFRSATQVPIWKASVPPYTTDGLHPTYAAHAVGAPEVSTFFSNVSVA